ncbi:MAG: GNAT family N-acetyltransferase [Pseudomonadota bacterium]
MIDVRPLVADALVAALPDVARLRISVFREWPYIYDGDLGYETEYLQVYRDAPDSILVGAFDQDRLIGAATGTPLSDHADDFAAAFAGTDINLDDVFYCAESVLLPEYRGQGLGHRFFDLREAHARALGYKKCAFCAVVRSQDHALRPPGARSLDPFWRGRGYEPLPGVLARFSWKDIDQDHETDKPLQFWSRNL